MEKHMSEVVYAPGSQLRNPRSMLRDMVVDLRASRVLAWRLLVRNISAQYRQTILGYVWAFLPPIVTTLIWVFLNAQKIFDVGETNVPYPVYVLTGTLVWQVFVDAMNSPLRLVSSSRAMLVKINFPREALILTGIGEVLFNFAVRLVLLVGIYFWFKIPVPGTVLFAPLGILALIAFGLMMGLFLTPLSVLYQDIQFGIGILTQLLFFLTPIVYPPPTGWPASLLVKANPISPLLATTRDWLTTGNTFYLREFLVVSCTTFLLILFGWVLYRIAMPHLIARISS